MKLHILLLLVIAFESFGTIAHARLGDTEADLTARYGNGSNAGQSFHMYYTQGWIITVWLMDGHSESERFQKNSGASDEEIATLLTLNAQGHAWGPQQVNPNTSARAWKRDDGATASTGNPSFALTIKTKKFLDAEQAQDAAYKKAHESSLKGF